MEIGGNTYLSSTVPLCQNVLRNILEECVRQRHENIKIYTLLSDCKNNFNYMSKVFLNTQHIETHYIRGKKEKCMHNFGQNT
jgi:hypothetical protein